MGSRLICLAIRQFLKETDVLYVETVTHRACRLLGSRAPLEPTQGCPMSAPSLRSRRVPCRRRATSQRSRAAYSRTSSANARVEGGRLTPSVLAVLRLTTN